MARAGGAKAAEAEAAAPAAEAPATEATTICLTEGSPPCLYTLFGFIDVSGNQRLSQAEVARMFRIIGFYAGDFAQPKPLAASREVLVPVALAGDATPPEPVRPHPDRAR